MKINIGLRSDCLCRHKEKRRRRPQEIIRRMFNRIFSSAADAVYDGVRDTALEIKDAFVARQEASDDLVSAATPDDRWFTPSDGWSLDPVRVKDIDTIPLPRNYVPKPWSPPELLVPTRNGAPEVYEDVKDRAVIGEVRIEVLEAEGLPQLLQIGTVDPYALVVFENSAARTSTVRNDTSPRWGAEAPRAFIFPVTCGNSSVHIALLDEDSIADDPLGRVVIDISQLFSRTVYDCWWPLQFGLFCSHSGKRGLVRLRLSVTWKEDRARLFTLTEHNLNYVLPFVTSKAKNAAGFAVNGRAFNPYQFRSKVFQGHMTDLRAAIHDLGASVCDFFFWRWPFVSTFSFVLWQLLVSMPTMLPACITLGMTGALVRAYLEEASATDAIATAGSRTTIWQLCMLLLCNTPPPPLQRYDGVDEDSEGEDSDGNDDDDDGDNGGGTKGGEKGKGARLFKRTASGTKRQRRPKQRVGEMVEAPTCYDILPTFLPEPGSLQEQMDQIFQQTDQEIREAAIDMGFSLNPLAKILGPIQYLLGEVNKGVRLVRRLWGWDDRLITFQLLMLLMLANFLLTGVGVLLSRAPWGLLFEWIFRILGAALFGPHMYLVGRSVKEKWARWVIESENFEDEAFVPGDKNAIGLDESFDDAKQTALFKQVYGLHLVDQMTEEEKKDFAKLSIGQDCTSHADYKDRVLKKWRRMCASQVRKMVEMEMHGTLPPEATLDRKERCLRPAFDRDPASLPCSLPRSDFLTCKRRADSGPHACALLLTPQAEQ